MIAIDSEFQSLIPPLSEDEYERLEKSILSEGVRDPIVTWNGTIIDGHNRYHICDEHGIKCPQVEKRFPSREAAKIWIIENQFGRRNLSPYDRSVLALKLEPLYAEEAKRVHDANGGDKKSDEYRESASQKSDAPKIRTDEQLAKLAGTSRDTIRKVKVIETEAAKGNETAIEARDAVKSGEKSIHKAYTEVHPKADKTDTRPICTICGKPIDEGDSYGHNPFKHKACASASTEENRGKRGGRPGRSSKYADQVLLSNEASFTIETLVLELEGSANAAKEAIVESLAINESMGVLVSDAAKKQLDDAIKSVFAAIRRIKEESNG